MTRTLTSLQQDLLSSSNQFDAQTLLKEAYELNDNIPTCCHPSRILNVFNPLIHGTYPVVNPMELITLGTDEVGVSDLDDLMSISWITYLNNVPFIH